MRILIIAVLLAAAVAGAMTCPFCKGAGQTSTVVEVEAALYRVYDVYYPRTWDEDGNETTRKNTPILVDPARYRCSNGHEWIIDAEGKAEEVKP